MAIARTVALRKKLVKIHTTRRLKKSIDYLREDIARHAKVSPKSVKLSMELSYYMVDRVSRNMSPVKITVDKVDGMVKADLAQELKTDRSGKSSAKPKTPAQKSGAANASKTKGEAPKQANPTQKPAAPKAGSPNPVQKEKQVS